MIWRDGWPGLAEISYTEWGPGRDDRLRELFAVVFGSTSPKSAPGIIEWQYWTNPVGPCRPMVACDGDRIVGFLLAWPLPIHLGERPARAGLFIDTATHPDYQRRGIHFELRRRVGEMARESGWEFIFANPRHERAERRKPGPNWIPLPAPRLFVRPVRSDWSELGDRLPMVARHLAMVRRHRSHPGGQRVAAVSGDLDGLVKRLWSDTENGIRPSHEWWHWRFALHPAAPYRFFEHRRDGRLEAAAVTRVSDHEHPTVQILDLLAVSDDAARAVVAAAVADSPGAGGVVVRASRDGLQGRAARAAGLIRVPDRIRGRRSHIGIRELLDDRVLPRVGMSWSVTAGNLDWS